MELFQESLDTALIKEITECTLKGWILGSGKFKQQIEAQTNRRVSSSGHGGDRKSKQSNPLILSLFYMLFLTSCGVFSYEEKFFSVSDVPPKFDVTICDHKIGELFESSERHVDFLIEQIKNTEEIGFYYYPLNYIRSDIANYVLSYRFGEISTYYPEFQSNMRVTSNSEALGVYVSSLHSMWATLKTNKTLVPIRGICD